MNENYIKKLIKIVEESAIGSLEVKGWGRSIKITRQTNLADNGQSSAPAIVQPVAPATTKAVQTTPQAEPSSVSEDVTVDKSKLIPITSPMVGTFYSAPAPDADSYVSLNEKIRVGQVVCIVEAMKLMNEIESEVSGRISEICVENGKPVEFGQTLFYIDPK
ncbi:MAG: acetyl-CoA carboxylase biotin carboxyl carrier protein [candidate division Zixibacteria bacterium]|nr:acetyl-CoA carboxylase biotin carboxyl carrier protein [candidate division Zixibacteria bacterium]